MSPGILAFLLPLAAAMLPSLAHAVDENAMFGGTAESKPAAGGSTTPSGRDENALFGGATPADKPTPSGQLREKAAPQAASPEPAAAGADAFASGDVLDNPLQIGGKYYQRLIFSGQQGAGADKAPVSMPLQFDGFLDGRPNDRLRAFVNARMFYDATRDQFSRVTGGGGAGSLAFSSTSAAPTSLGAGAGAAVTPNNPGVSLDQAWLKFDIDRSVFVTAGRQHVKWGISRFWNPTDFLHPQRRDPLLSFDPRLGSTMAKFDFPLEAQRLNLSAVALFDNPDPASTLGRMGAAFRAEKVWGNTEVGLDFIARGGRAPAFGADFSSPAGPFDIYGEAAVFTEAPFQRFQVGGAPAPGADLSTLVNIGSFSGAQTQSSVGGNYSFGWRESRLATIGLEYFYNQMGYSDPAVYPALIFFGQYQPFQTGRHYAAVYLTAEGPDAEKRTSYTFSTLGNMSDKSFVSRVDFTWRVLTYLTFDAYVDGHYGTRGGEFNFALETPALTYAATPIAPISIPPTFFNVGMGLRMSL